MFNVFCQSYPSLRNTRGTSSLRRSISRPSLKEGKMMPFILFAQYAERKLFEMITGLFSV